MMSPEQKRGFRSGLWLLEVLRCAIAEGDQAYERGEYRIYTPGELATELKARLESVHSMSTP